MRREISFEDSRKIMLDILADIDAFCRKENINYSLGEGTLIGAIRHKGMIPWDDDVDLLMLREDYEKFLATYKSTKYVIQNFDYGLNSWFLFIKVVHPNTIIKDLETGEEPYGLWVTIFPIDNVPDSEEDLNRMIKQIKTRIRLFRIRNKVWDKKGLLQNAAIYLLHLLLLVFPKDYWHKKAVQAMCKYNNVKTARRGFFSIFWIYPWICSSKAFDEYIDTEFEGKQYKIIKGYDEYLRHQYGDYMQLPPEDKRSPKHDYQAYYID